jgi:hypothetical protein
MYKYMNKLLHINMCIPIYIYIHIYINMYIPVVSGKTSLMSLDSIPLLNRKEIASNPFVYI